MQALLVLEDGFSLKGETFSGRGEVFGEVVFNTSMTGYQEMITDPSYQGQILVLTYPMVGNYGVNSGDSESARPRIEGLLVKECCPRPSNRRAEQSLNAYLDEHKIIGLEGIDTRSLTLHLRSAGTMYGVISTEEHDPLILEKRVLAYKEQNNRDLVAEVSTPVQYVWSQSIPVLPPGSSSPPGSGPELHVVLYDFGIKYNTLRALTARNCRITVVPHQTNASEVLNLQPDGILLSNGPGDPQELIEVIPNIRSLLGRIPLFGICLGHQLLAMALGHSTFKLKFGHRGGNHPVKDLATGKVEITAQNHGYCVQLDGEPDGTTVTHINLNDGTLEGLANKELNCFSVQYHPEAAPGPHDAAYLFDRFISLINENRAKGVGISA